MGYVKLLFPDNDEPDQEAILETNCDGTQIAELLSEGIRILLRDYMDGVEYMSEDELAAWIAYKGFARWEEHRPKKENRIRTGFGCISRK